MLHSCCSHRTIQFKHTMQDNVSLLRRKGCTFNGTGTVPFVH